MAEVLYTLSEVATLFAACPETVRRWIRAGDLPAVRVGREYKVSRADLEAFYRRRGGRDLFKAETDARDEADYIAALQDARAIRDDASSPWQRTEAEREIIAIEEELRLIRARRRSNA